MTRPTSASGARIARLRRTAARLSRRLTPPPPPSAPPTVTPPTPAPVSTTVAPTTSSPTPSPAAGAAAATSTSPSPGHWWTRLERSVALLVSVSTLLVGGLALVTVRQATGEQHLTRDGQVTDRYTAAVTNLGDDNEEVRLGGLYSLQRIAEDSDRDAPTVVQVISAYVRSHAPLPKNNTKGPTHPTNDVAAALSILTAPHTKNVAVDLTGATLLGANLTDAYLGGAYLTRADLGGAHLGGADLGGAHLNGAYLTGAYLNGAYLNGVKGYTPSPIPKGQKTTSPTTR